MIQPRVCCLPACIHACICTKIERKEKIEIYQTDNMQVAKYFWDMDEKGKSTHTNRQTGTMDDETTCCGIKLSYIYNYICLRVFCVHQANTVPDKVVFVNCCLDTVFEEL